MVNLLDLNEMQKRIDGFTKSTNNYKTGQDFLISWFRGIGNIEQKEYKFTDGKFMEIIYGDNDYSNSLRAALEFIWLSTNRNNGYLIGKVGFSNRSIADMIIELHNNDILKPLIIRTWHLIEMLDEAQSNTMGLYWEKIGWERKIVAQPIDAKSMYIHQLNIYYELHKNNNFSKELQKGEHICWNLETGEAIIF